jgi:hypothetical protein
MMRIKLVISRECHRMSNSNIFKFVNFLVVMSYDRIIIQKLFLRLLNYHLLELFQNVYEICLENQIPRINF